MKNLIWPTLHTQAVVGYTILREVFFDIYLYSEAIATILLDNLNISTLSYFYKSRLPLELEEKRHKILIEAHP